MLNRAVFLVLCATFSVHAQLRAQLRAQPRVQPRTQRSEQNVTLVIKKDFYQVFQDLTVFLGHLNETIGNQSSNKISQDQLNNLTALRDQYSKDIIETADRHKILRAVVKQFVENYGETRMKEVKELTSNHNFTSTASTKFIKDLHFSRRNEIEMMLDNVKLIEKENNSELYGILAKYREKFEVIMGVKPHEPVPTNHKLRSGITIPKKLQDLKKKISNS
ncbi:hypothetical protein QAD02_009916 [Eretmocerus hayati]|uniref:Uncharacterized protein n=1 Tax=Eretmocerus hayati TaxID=131215 RepID=A0ACC2NBW8_9HYME|nr:hypothetical protein QAD02_009916 [Eretmocerus hayati]